MIFQLSLTNPPQVLKEGDHPSFQLKQAKKIDKERGHVDASVKGAQHVKLRGSADLLKKIQNEKKVLDEVFGDLADPMASGGSIINRGKTNHLFSLCCKSIRSFTCFYSKVPIFRRAGVREVGHSH